MQNLSIDSEVAFLFYATTLCKEAKTGYDGAWQIAPFQCSIPYTDKGVSNLIDLKEALADRFPALLAFGEKRAKKAFVSTADTITKPSYIGRIRDFRKNGIDQLCTMTDVASSEPASGGLVFSVFSPHDLIDRRRPGYVPCLISGSFLLHEDELQLNAFFRSQSVVEFGIFDLIFLRQFQLDFLQSYNKNARQEARPGSLNLLFGRIIVHRRFLKRNESFIRRDDLIDAWIGQVEQSMLESRLNEFAPRRR